MNMDYALCNALGHNTDGLSRALTFYDVNCQYNKYLRRRVDESLHLTIPPGMEIIPGIGLWHVHGHQDKCFVRYASNFILGAARIDGEIMETLWAPLNVISPSARGMSTPHRQECLDFQMNDCNFMKMIRIGTSGPCSHCSMMPRMNQTPLRRHVLVPKVQGGETRNRRKQPSIRRAQRCGRS
jgi:Kyakuja-Dileera-Zisupton transposase